MTMTVRYVSFEPPRRVAMTMISGPWFFERFAGTWTFKSLGSNRTTVSFHYHFVLRPGWLKWLDVLFGLMLSRTISGRLRGLKRFAEKQTAML